jgi:YgiT-type zinc finger domain-containing protein
MTDTQNEQTDLTCSLCGAQTARLVRRPQVVGKGERLVMVNNVPMYSCRNCGHTYFTAEVARMLDQIRLHPSQYTEPKAIPVADLANC